MEHKSNEATDAVHNGAEEVDMVINIGWVKDQRWDDLLEEIKAVKQHCEGRLLKVIIETCLLTDEEKIKMCEIVSDSGADYIKTSTGFSTAGATFHDVELFAKHVKPGVKIKAAGGISSLEDAEKFIELGASRLGTSRVVKIVKKLEGALAAASRAASEKNKMKREEKPHSRFGRARQSMNSAPQSGRKGRSASGGVDGTARTAGQCRLCRSMLISRSMRT